MSLDIIMMALGGGSVSMPPSILAERSDGGTPAGFSLNSSGTRFQSTGGAPVAIAPWFFGSNPSLYEVRSTVNSGTFSTDPSAGSWISLGTTRLWERGAGAATSQTVNATIQIRNASTLAVVSTTTLILTCDRT